jgi:hypothetical protein
MKIHLTLLFVLFTLLTKGQVYSGVVELDSTYSSSTLYSNALSFFAMAFKSSNDVIQMKDPVSGKVIGKGIADDRNVTITISCKDGKYKYEISIDEISGYIFTLETNNFGQNKTWGKISMSGLSQVAITFNDNKEAVINKNDVYFFFSEFPDAYRWYYNENHNGHHPCLGYGSKYQEWKKMIDDEFIKNNNFSHLTKPTDKIVNSLVSKIKTEMAKSDW